MQPVHSITADRSGREQRLGSQPVSFISGVFHPIVKTFIRMSFEGDEHVFAKDEITFAEDPFLEVRIGLAAGKRSQRNNS